MNKLKNSIIMLVLIVGIFAGLYGVARIKYFFWRAEHPQAKTWTFFIPR